MKYQDFFSGLNEIDRRVFQKTAESYALEFARKHASEDASLRQGFAYLLDITSDSLEKIVHYNKRNIRFNKRIRLVHSEADRAQLILDYSEELGANKKQLKGDRKALSRYLDAEAMNDRLAKKIGNTERSMIYLLGRIEHVFTTMLNQSNDNETTLQDWNALEVSELFEVLLFYSGDARVRVATLKVLSGLLNALTHGQRPRILSADIKQLVLRISQDSNLNTELQIAALSVLVFYSKAEFLSVATQRGEQPLNDQEPTLPADDFFVRAAITQLVGKNYQNLDQPNNLLNLYAQDPSDFVRQELIRTLEYLSSHEAIPLLAQRIQNEQIASVRATALLMLPEFVIDDDDIIKQLRTILVEAFQNEDHELCIRCLLDITPSIAAKIAEFGDSSRLSQWFNTFEKSITALHANSNKLNVRRWAANARESLWAQSNIDLREKILALQTAIQVLPLSKRSKITLPAIGDLSREELGRALSLIAQNDFGLDVEPTQTGLKLTRWYDFRFRLWRFLYELKHSATDKRQGHKHMSGRIFYGSMSIPSNRLAEQTQTKVPGEPVNITAEDGPRNYLPLIDELISSLDQGWPTIPIEIYTSEGITSILPPNGFVARLRARLKMIWRYDEFSRLRNWSDDMAEKSDAYLTEVSKLGFKFSIRGYTDPRGQHYPPHSSLTRFLPSNTLSSLTLPSIALLWTDLKEYFFSIYSNSILQLWIFLTGFFAIFIGKHAIINVQMNRARAAIPLSVGGWGTRGKSGTERLKASVFNGLGLNVISKTTGCEAMFLEGNAHQPLQEMFLFRPYDKATIWEQVNLMKLARRLNADVFLWECMGLTPSYVHVLQRNWMRDDIATITNTYPDHEDVQGPAGIDIPQVMTEFIPRNSTLVTSEEIMYPILSEAAKVLKTKCVPVTWRETNTITDDIINRFPYEEHPNNIALVASMSSLLGIDRPFTLKAMADHVVLDLGVLKTYPASLVNDRTLQYVMGNSANERLGALGNWRRMGFDQHSLNDEPNIWVSTIVNNRADRVPRSKVFASILVNDVSADQHMIIGTNVDGFETFLHEAWDEAFANFSIWQTSDGDSTDIAVAKKNCLSTAKRFRITTHQSQIIGRIKVMFESINIPLSEQQLEEFANNDVDYCSRLLDQHDSKKHRSSIVSKIIQWQQELSDLDQFLESLSTLNSDKANSTFTAFIKQCFFNRVDFVYDSLIVGEEIIQKIAEQTPVGMTNRIMGMQNIKGTGLDFVYRWQAWERCHKACEKLNSDDERVLVEALRELRAFEEYGCLSNDYVIEEIEKHRTSPLFQTESMQSDIQEIVKKISTLTSQTDIINISNETNNKNKLLESGINMVEQFLDLGDAVTRRKKADQIYQDLAAYRISRSRAAIELQELTKRQKGGWLIKRLL